MTNCQRFATTARGREIPTDQHEMSALSRMVPTFCVTLRIPSLPPACAGVLLDAADVGLDLLERPRRGVAIEVAVEVDFVAHETDLPISRIALAGVDPGVRDVGLHLAIEEGLDTLREWHALCVSKLGIWLRVAVLVPADGRRLVAFGERGEHGLADRDRKLQAGLLRRCVEKAVELGPVFHHRRRQSAHELADRLLQRAA